MRPASIIVPTALLLLAACNRLDSAGNMADSGDGGGRYAGVGIYGADGLWEHVEGVSASNEQNSARLDDDSQIIVLVDRQTGEVRQCGNRSGFCVAMNPWKGPAPALPAKLSLHADQLGETANIAQEPGPAPASADGK